MNNKFIYLDHAAATPMDPRVLTAMTPYFIDDFYNPSSPYLPAVKIRQDYEEAKHRIATTIGAKPDEIIITAGATESINLAFTIGGHIIVSNIEHQAVLSNAELYKNTIVAADERGVVSSESIKSAIQSDTKLVSIGLANNELGTIQPIREIAGIVRDERNRRLQSGDKTPIYLHCDASQGAGLIDINVARLGVDMLTLNAGKIYGPKQLGLLWIASYVNLQPIVLGGGQERGLRSGTENVAGTIGFARALELAAKHRKYESDRLAVLRDKLQKRLLSDLPTAIISGHSKHRLASHLHISFPEIDGERLVFLLESEGVLVATGSACAANKGTRSHVLVAIGLEPKVVDGSIRISLGHLSTDENTQAAAQIIVKVVNKEYERIKR